MTHFDSEQEYLQQYDASRYVAPLFTVDVAIFTILDDELKVLLHKRPDFPEKDKWALPGGFVDVQKDSVLMDTAVRKLEEKTGVRTHYLEQVETHGSNRRDPRAWSVTTVYMALLHVEDIECQILENNVRWFSLAKAEKMRALAFDHKNLITQCAERLRNKVQYTALPLHFLPKQFTLSEVQGIFEIILQAKLEKKSFRRRLLAAEILEETGEQKLGANRPAALYRVRDRSRNHYFSRALEGAR